MLRVFLLLSLCIITSFTEDDHWLNCKPKPGCSIARCDPKPAGQWFSKDRGPDEYAILCQKKETSDNVSDLLKTSEEIMTELVNLKKRLERREREGIKMKLEIMNLQRKNYQMEIQFKSMEEKVERLMKLENTTMEFTTRLERPENSVAEWDPNTSRVAVVRSGIPVEPATNTAGESAEELKTEISSEPEKTKNIEDLCLLHDDKCLFPVVQRMVNYAEGIVMCESFGGNLANIYNQNQMDNVMKYIREYRLNSSSGQISFRLGMKFDPLNGKLRLRDGGDASDDLKWWPNQPISGERYSDYTNVILTVDRNQSSDHQYLFNTYPGFRWSFVLCENLCPVSHGKKCFFPVTERGLNYTEGIAACEKSRGILANIYNKSHMYDVLKYIKELRRKSNSPQMFFRLGMKFDPLGKKLSLRDGDDASDDLKWWPNYPLTGERYSDYTTVILGQSNENQYLSNIYPGFPWFFVFCETEEVGTAE